MSKVTAVKHRRPGFMKWLTHLVVRMLGWRLEGEAPKENKYVAIFAPHTSNWDAFFGLCIRFGIEERSASWMLKDNFFRFPVAGLLRWLGAIPIDRGRASNVVNPVVEIFNERDEMVLGITPEGTRKRVPKWKKGFYYIAVKANVPILMCYVDFARKVAGIGPILYPTGDIDADMRTFRDFYSTISPKYPDNWGPVWEWNTPQSARQD